MIIDCASRLSEILRYSFVFRYFFYVLTALIVLGVINGLVLLPVVLSFIGPPSEVVAIDGSAHLDLPTPPFTPRNEFLSNREAHGPFTEDNHGISYSYAKIAR